MPNSIVISCIYREDKNECFVTSVDAIYLLEALVGVRFSVEEKNRIRRNLEGFRPVTVSKAKAGAEDFFKLVMGFPNPKPRNIEKDVKVFPWKVFGTALKKIIGKYVSRINALPSPSISLTVCSTAQSASYVYPQNGNMAPSQTSTSERNPSPPIAPYTIPAPLMPAPGENSTPMPPPPTFNAYENGTSSGDRNSFHLDPNEIFVGSSSGFQGIPPTPGPATPSYQGMSSSSSSSLPTIHHPGSGSEVHIHQSGGSSSGSGIRHSPLPMDPPQLVYPSGMGGMSKDDEYSRDGLDPAQYDPHQLYR